VGNHENDWQKTDPDLRAHPSFKLLCAALAIPPILGDGLLSGIWRMAYRQAEDGDLSRFTAEALMAGADWTYQQDPEAVVDALVAAKFLERTEDGRLLIHDWDGWGGAARAQRRRWAQAKAETRHEKSTDVQGSPTVVRDCHRAKRESKTLRSKDLPDYSEEFTTWWETYGKGGSRAKALECYAHWRNHGASAADLLLAATNYRAACNAASRYMKDGSTFLAKRTNIWEEWMKPESATPPAGPHDLTTPEHTPHCFFCKLEVTPEQQATSAVWAEGSGWAHAACAREAS
jgi:hypothetical protein